MLYVYGLLSYITLSIILAHMFYRPPLKCIKGRILIEQEGMPDMDRLVQLVREILAKIEQDLDGKDSRRIGWFDFGDMYMKKHGFEALGCGNFSYAFKHIETGYAVKICGYAFGGFDAYPKYVKWIKYHPNLKHLPEILHFEEVPDKYYFAIMPTYEANRLGGSAVWALSQVIYGHTYKPEDIPESYRDTLVETCTELGKFTDNKDVDLHGSNIMAHNGVPVLTDPFSYDRA